LYSDNVNFVNSSNAWFKRGGCPKYETGAGSFAFAHTDGGGEREHFLSCFLSPSSELAETLKN